MKRPEKLAIGFIVLSCVSYGALLGVPFLPTDLTTKVAIGSGLVVAGEGTFWLGVAIAGRELMRRYRNRLSPGSWFRSRG